MVESSLGPLALTLPRIAAAFIMLPLLTNENMPATARNSFFVSLAIVAFPAISAAGNIPPVTTLSWPIIVLKEILLGLIIGFAFGVIFWAIGSAGNLIDAKVGSSIAVVADPLQGHQTSLWGLFFSQLAAWLFMASGAFLIFLDILLGSYAIWPVGSYTPKFDGGGLGFFIAQFDFFMTTAFVLAAPAIVTMMLVDIGLGLVNRYAQQMQLISFSMPIKSLIATWIIILMLGVLVEFTLRGIANNKALLSTLKGIL
ncbi:MAG: type III secretion system export apparatus subunit SctT [Gammaproteobacteria bacterium]